MLIGRSKKRFRVTNSIALLLFRYQICYHFGWPKVAQHISLSSTAKQNWFAILCYSLYLFLSLIVQNQGDSGLEWFSFECRKTKTKVITLANHIGHRQYIEPIKTRSNYMWLTQSAGKSCERVTIGFGFTSDWMKRWRESFKPIVSCRKCKTNYFSTLKWKPL